jgi:hypothetical protein
MNAKRRNRLALAGAALAVAAGSLGLVAGAGGAGTTLRVSGSEGLAVYDNRGKLVGDVFDLNGVQPTVAVKVGQGQATFVANEDSLQPTGNTHGSPLLYESTDCTGQAFAGFGPGGLDPGSGGILGPPLVMNGTTLYVPNGDEQEITVNSALNQEGSFCEQITFSHTDRPLRELVDLGLVFRPPFSVRAR